MNELHGTARITTTASDYTASKNASGGVRGIKTKEYPPTQYKLDKIKAVVLKYNIQPTYLRLLDPDLVSFIRDINGIESSEDRPSALKCYKEIKDILDSKEAYALMNKIWK